MGANVPVDELCRAFTVDEDVFGDGNGFVLQRVAVGCEAPTAPGGPARAFGLDPDDIVDKVVLFLYENAVYIERNGYSFRGFVAAGAPDQHGRDVDDEETSFRQDAVDVLNNLAQFQKILFISDVIGIFRARIVVRGRCKYQVHALSWQILQDFLAVPVCYRIAQR